MYPGTKTVELNGAGGSCPRTNPDALTFTINDFVEFTTFSFHDTEALFCTKQISCKKKGNEQKPITWAGLSGTEIREGVEMSTNMGTSAHESADTLNGRELENDRPNSKLTKLGLSTSFKSALLPPNKGI
jgi:hypothetical protein